jgi:hypothetical protein
MAMLRRISGRSKIVFVMLSLGMSGECAVESVLVGEER